MYPNSCSIKYINGYSYNLGRYKEDGTHEFHHDWQLITTEQIQSALSLYSLNNLAPVRSYYENEFNEPIILLTCMIVEFARRR